MKICQRRLVKLKHFSVGVKQLVGTIQKLVQKYELLNQLSDLKNKPRSCHSRTVENIVAAAEGVEEITDLSISRRSFVLGLQQMSLHLNLYKVLCLMAYNVN